MARLFVGGSVLLLAALSSACGNSPSAPSPSSPASQAAMLTTPAPGFAACLAAAGSDRRCFAATAQSRAVGAAATVPGTPSTLTAAVTGSTVALNWIAPAAGDAATSYIIEAGSASGLANLAAFATGTPATSFSTTGVPAGTYFVRVRAQNQTGASGTSNEVVVVVGGPTVCVSAPNAPSGLSATITGSLVVLIWSPPSGGCALASYVLQAGSASGLSNLVNSATGNTATSYTAGGVPPGTYFVRIVAANAYGLSAPSNEVPVIVAGPTFSGPNYSGAWQGTYRVTQCLAGLAGGSVGPAICGSALRVGTTLPMTLALTQTGAAVQGTLQFGGFGSTSVRGTVDANGRLVASGVGSYSVGGRNYVVDLGSFSATLSGQTMTATWGEFFVEAGTSALVGSADVRLSGSATRPL